MLTLFNKKLKKGLNKQVKGENIVEAQEVTAPIEPVIDEDQLKKSIASKLQQYEPVEREANFTGPKYYQ